MQTCTDCKKSLQHKQIKNIRNLQTINLGVELYSVCGKLVLNPQAVLETSANVALLWFVHYRFNKINLEFVN